MARQLRDLVLGKDPRDTGVLWELKGWALGLPVRRLLGGALRDRIEVYASPVPLMPTPERSAQEAAAFVEQGYRALKLKIGRGVETDVESPAAGGALSASRRPMRRRLRSVAAG